MNEKVAKEVKNQPKTDPLVAAVRKADRSSKQCEWDNLAAEESRWKRKVTDPLVAAVRKAYRSSKQCEWDNLVAEESRWKRKVTIATNKLAEVRNKMNQFAAELVKDTDTTPKA